MHCLPPEPADVRYDARARRWELSRYEEVRALLGDARLTGDRLHGFVERAPAAAVAALHEHASWLLAPGPDDVDWIGPVVRAGLQGAAIATLRRSVAAVADRLLDDLLRRECFDVVEDYALALSGAMAAELLGVSQRDGQQQLMAWGLDVVTFLNNADITTEGAQRMARSAGAMVDYGQELLGDCRAELQDGFLGALRRAARARGRVLDEEGIGNLMLPVITGHVDLAHLIASSIWLLLKHDDPRAAASADARALAGAISETLRYAPPAASVPRFALQDLVVAGHAVAAGELVLLDLAAANRDPARFPDPDRFDLTRSQQGALGFGHGPHACIAAGLARAHAAIAVGALLRRAPCLSRDGDGRLRWRAVPGMRALEVLDVRV